MCDFLQVCFDFKAEKSVEMLSSRVNSLEDVNAELEEKLESAIEKLQESLKIVDEFERCVCLPILVTT